MRINEDDYTLLNDLYNELLELLSMYKFDNINNIISFINNFYKKISRDKIDLSGIYNLPSIGIYSIAGFNVCRTANTFLYDYLKKMGFDLNVEYIKTELDTWKRVNPIFANHLTVVISDNGLEYHLDLYNEIYFIYTDDEIKKLDLNDISVILDNRVFEIITRIKSIMLKYKTCDELGIKNIYSYNY